MLLPYEEDPIESFSSSQDAGEDRETPSQSGAATRCEDDRETSSQWGAETRWEDNLHTPSQWGAGTRCLVCLLRLLALLCFALLCFA